MGKYVLEGVCKSWYKSNSHIYNAKIYQKYLDEITLRIRSNKLQKIINRINDK